jgi:CBS domain-containing protein
MTRIALPLMETLGFSRADTRRLMRAGRVARRRTSDLASNVADNASMTYAWIAVGAVAALWLVARQRSSRGRRVRDVMIHHVLTVEPTATIREAAQRMREANVGMLPVVEHGRLRGVITDRDIVVRAIARGADSVTTRVEECATMEIACARPEWTVDQAMAQMSESQVGRLPVVDRDDRVVGIVTLSSLALRSRADAIETARDVSRRSARTA